MTIFAPPELLSAYSYAVDGSDPDEPLLKGTHLRVFAGVGPSFPLAPFAVFTIRSQPSEPVGLYFTDGRGQAIASADLSTHGTIEMTPVFADTETSHTVSLEPLGSSPGQIDGAALLDQHGRTVAERRDGPFAFSAPVLSRVRIWGSSSWVGLTSRRVGVDDVLAGQEQRAVDLLGLPVTGCHPWYVGVHDHDQAIDRVKRGAPTRLTELDEPEGPFGPVGPDEEAARVEAILASSRFGDGLEQQVLSMVEDTSAPPWAQAETRDLDGSKQRATVPRLGHVQLAALDPGAARFLGFATRIDDLPDLAGGEGWAVLAVVALLAIDPRLADALPLLAPWLKSPDLIEPKLVDMVTRAVQQATGRDPECPLDKLMDDVRSRGLLARAAVAVTAPLPPWRPPQLPDPELVDRRWQAPGADRPSSLYRAAFAFPHAPLAGMAAVAGNFEGTWVPRHDTVDVDGFDPPVRRTPRVLGHESEASARVRTGLPPGSSATLEPAGLLADENLPADAGTVTYRFRGSDFFGRFGQAVEMTLDAPLRPSPPPPVTRYELDLLTDGLEALPPTGKLSPGELRLTFAVPPVFDEAALRTAIAVPGLAELAAGSLPIASASVTVAGATQPDVDLTAPGLYSVAVPLPALDPQSAEEVVVTAVFTDTAGAASKVASTTVHVVDKRPLVPIESGIGLFWTSAPGPAPDVQLQLTWDGPANALYRVYVTDQQGLGLTAADVAEHVPGAAPSRARVAEVGANKVLGGGHVDKRVFRLLGETVKADGTGRAVLSTTLPRSIETVQFLRVVPLSGEGAEAPFDACGIVPVAVPDSRRPPPPRLEGSVDAVTGKATLVVTADGFDGVALRRDEPGLFDAAAGAALAPSFRIRRAVGAVADPIYGREAAHGELARDASRDPDVLFTGTVPDDNDGRGLEPFVRYVYWAEVRLPPERRLPVGVVPIDAGFDALDPANAADYPRPMSLPSPPRTLMQMPPEPPGAPEQAAITATRSPLAGGEVEVTIEIANPPKAHQLAIGPYRLAVWTQWHDQPIQAITGAGGAPLDGVWPDLSDGAVTFTVAPPAAPGDPNAPIDVRLAYVDPSGRLGGMTTVSVA